MVHCRQRYNRSRLSGVDGMVVVHCRQRYDRSRLSGVDGIFVVHCRQRYNRRKLSGIVESHIASKNYTEHYLSSF